jgi:hypothetical protein
MTRERACQTEAKAIAKVRAARFLDVNDNLVKAIVVRLTKESR